MTPKAHDKSECVYQDTIEACVKKLDRLHVEIYGNGGTGMKDDISAIRAQMRISIGLLVGVLGAIAASVGAAIMRGVF